MGTIGYVYHDYHKETPKGRNLESSLNNKGLGAKIGESGITHFNESGFVSQQEGIIRTNCLDCLDRTNAVQSLFAQNALQIQINALNVDNNHVNKFKGSFYFFLFAWAIFLMLLFLGSLQKPPEWAKN